MDNVVDVRPDKFLRAMRETGNFGVAATQAGLEVSEAENLCRENSKFDLAVIDCHMEWLEDRVMQQARDHLQAAKTQHMGAHKARHPEEGLNEAT